MSVDLGARRCPVWEEGLAPTLPPSPHIAPSPTPSPVQPDSPQGQTQAAGHPHLEQAAGSRERWGGGGASGIGAPAGQPLPAPHVSRDSRPRGGPQA